MNEKENEISVQLAIDIFVMMIVIYAEGFVNDFCMANANMIACFAYDVWDFLSDCVSNYDI